MTVPAVRRTSRRTGRPSLDGGELAFDYRGIFDDGLPDTVVVLEGASENSNRVGALEGSSEDPARVEVDR